MDWFALFLMIEFGISPDSDLAMYEAPVFVNDQVVFYMDFEVEAVFWEHFYVGGGVKIYAWKEQEGWNNFWPSEANLRAFAGLRFGIFDIGARHYCIHPIIPWLTSFDYQPKWEAAHTEFFIRARGTL